MHFGTPQFFWLLLGIPLLIAFFIWAYGRRTKLLSHFASIKLQGRLTIGGGLQRQVVRWSLIVLFFVFLIMALVRPRFGVKTEMLERSGVDVIVALDVSESMLAQDVTPSRIERAKYEISKFIEQLRGDRIGIVAFAGQAHVQCPLTLDYGAAKMFLDAISTDWIELQGTIFADAIRAADKSFKSKIKKHKVLIIISDGEDHQGDALEAAREAAADGVKIYTVGIGSESGVPIAVGRGNGTVIYKKDRTGNLVMTRLNSTLLEQIAIAGNGTYFHAGTDLDMTRIYGEISRMEKRQFGLNKMTIYEERYQIFLFIAMLLLVIEFFIPERGRKKDVWKGRFE